MKESIEGLASECFVSVYGRLYVYYDTYPVNVYIIGARADQGPQKIVRLHVIAHKLSCYYPGESFREGL